MINEWLGLWNNFLKDQYGNRIKKLPESISSTMAFNPPSEKILEHLLSN